MALDPLARKVAGRWGWSVAMVAPNPTIPTWVTEWAIRVHAGNVKTAYADKGYLHDLQFQKTQPMPVVKTDRQLFDEARESIAAMLPSFLALLKQKFRDTFHANASMSGTHIYYYFAPKHPLENIAVSLGAHNHRTFISVLYAPVDLHGHVDYSKAVELREDVQDPELAGLALMRLGRKVLGRV
jgi:hypothetical protein